MKTPLDRIRFGAISLAAVFILSVIGYRYIGDYDWLQAVWMVVVTLSTVGYGERSELPVETQLLSIGVIIFGVTATVHACGGFIQLLLEGEIDRVLGKRKMTKEISRLRNHVIICGFGRLGQDLANQLRHRNVDYLVVDSDPEKASIASEHNTPLVVGDATLESILEQTNLQHAKALVTALPTDAENVFITLTARNLQSDILIIAKSAHESSCRKLRQAGANRTVMPHRVGAQQMERMISRPSIADMVDLLAEASHFDMEFDEFFVSPDLVIVGQTIAESQIKNTYNLLVVGIKKTAGEFLFNPAPTVTINADDTVLVIGDVKNINRMKQDLLQN